MPKQVKQRTSDINEIAHNLVERSTSEPSESTPQPFSLSEYMSKIGSKGGKIGGKQRLKTMSAKQRKRIAKKAAQARWKKH